MGFWIMGTDHLKARCICKFTSGLEPHRIDTPGCPIHDKPVPVPYPKCSVHGSQPDSDCPTCFSDPGNWHPIEERFDVINKAQHYNSHPSGVEAILIVRHMTFCAGNAFKYVFRAELKNGKQDFEKALYYWKDVVANQDPIWLPDRAAIASPFLIRVINTEPSTPKVMFYNRLSPSLSRHGIPVLEKLIEAA